MAFNAANLTQCSPLNATTGPALFVYETTTDTVTTVSTSTYFTPFANSFNQGIYPFTFNVGDQIQAVCSNGTVNLYVSAINPITTAEQTTSIIVGPNSVNTAAIQDLAVTAAKLAADSVQTAKITDANVTLAKLASGISPSHIIKFAAQYTTTGGAASEAITVTGAAAATDRAFVQVVDNGTSNVTVLQAVVTNNTLTVTFNADPGNDTIINYQIIRAAS